MPGHLWICENEVANDEALCPTKRRHIIVPTKKIENGICIDKKIRIEIRIYNCCGYETQTMAE
jgi:hypothetical protein